MIKVLTHIHNYLPGAATGADIMACAINTYLADNGFDVTVAIDNCPEDYVYNNHKVTSNKVLLGEKYEAADLILTHLVFRRECSQIAERFGKPIFHVVHNTEVTSLPPGKPDNYLIYNSQWVADAVNFNLESIVCNPPTFIEDWANDKDHFTAPFISMINLTHNKGPEILKMLSMHFTSLKFMGVRGSYGEQFQQNLQNVSYEHYTNNIKSIYDQTKILLVPSISESWSICAAEAMASGIPVVCSDLPGLRENCGDAAMYCTGNRSFIDAIELLHKPEVYYSYVEKGLRRAEEKNHLRQLEKLLNFIKSKIKNNEVNEKIIKPEKKQIVPAKEKVEVKIEKEKKQRPSAAPYKKHKNELK